MWDNLKDVIGDMFVVAFGVVIVLHMALFFVWGSMTIYENNVAIRAIEMVMGVGMVVFGIERFVNDIRRRER